MQKYPSSFICNVLQNCNAIYFSQHSKIYIYCSTHAKLIVTFLVLRPADATLVATKRHQQPSFGNTVCMCIISGLQVQVLFWQLAFFILAKYFCQSQQCRYTNVVSLSPIQSIQGLVLLIVVSLPITVQRICHAAKVTNCAFLFLLQRHTLLDFL